jgi:hypothetical protein
MTDRVLQTEKGHVVASRAQRATYTANCESESAHAQLQAAKSGRRRRRRRVNESGPACVRLFSPPSSLSIDVTQLPCSEPEYHPRRRPTHSHALARPVLFSCSHSNSNLLHHESHFCQTPLPFPTIIGSVLSVEPCWIIDGDHF